MKLSPLLSAMSNQWRGHALGAGLVVLAVFTSASAPVAQSDSARASEGAPKPGNIADVGDSLLWMEMRNVDLHIDARSAMRVGSLRGQVIPTEAGTIAWLDRPSSFRVRATWGVVSLDGDAITT